MITAIWQKCLGHGDDNRSHYEKKNEKEDIRYLDKAIRDFWLICLVFNYILSVNYKSATQQNLKK